MGTWAFLSQQFLQTIIPQLLQYAVASGLLSCLPCFPPHIFSYSDISPEWVQSVLFSKLWASVGLIMKSSYVEGRKKEVCFLRQSKMLPNRFKIQWTFLTVAVIALLSQNQTQVLHVIEHATPKCLARFVFCGRQQLNCCQPPSKQWSAFWSRSRGNLIWWCTACTLQKSALNLKVHASVEFGFIEKFGFMVL